MEFFAVGVAAILSVDITSCKGLVRVVRDFSHHVANINQVFLSRLKSLDPFKQSWEPVSFHFANIISTFRRFGTKCSGCGHGISPQDLVRKARDQVFHLKCFTCFVCRKQLLTGEELYVVDDTKFVCKEDYNHRLNGEMIAYCDKPIFPWLAHSCKHKPTQEPYASSKL